VTTFTSTGIVVTGPVAGGVAWFWDWSGKAKSRKQNSGGIRVKTMPTLDDTGVRVVTFHPHRR
jgi:hypothetical protein